MHQANNQSEDITSKELILRIAELWRYLASKKIIIFLLIFCGGAVGVTYAYFQKTLYVATSTFVLDDVGGSNPLTQYSGLASMIGIDAGGSGGGIFQGDNLLELYKSQSVIQKALLSPVDIDNKSMLLVERYIYFNKLRKSWLENKNIGNVVFTRSKQGYSRLQDSLLKQISSDINKNYLSVSKLDKKLSIIKVDVKCTDEVFSKLFNDQIVKIVNEFYIQTKTKKALQNYNVLQHQTDSIKNILNGAILGVAQSLDNNPNINIARQVLRTPSQKKQIDVETNKAILTQLIQNLEISKVSLRKETPLIQVIDSPIFPLDKIKLGKTKAGLIGMFLMGFLGCLFYTCKFFIRN